MATKHLPVICGETTCYDKETETMCRFVLTTNFGQRWVCGLFRDKSGDYKRLEESDPSNPEKSMLERLPECLATIK